jgi:phage terminase small subunit
MNERPASEISHEIFAQGIANGKTVTQAALDAGYSEKSAASQGSRLLKNRKVADRIQGLRRQIQERHAVTVERILQELARVGFVDISEAFDDDGNLLPLKQMPEDVRRAVSAIDFEEIFELQPKEQGRGMTKVHVGNMHKLKFNGKIEALKLLGQHLEMFTEKVKVEDMRGKAERLRAARARAYDGRR